MSARADLTRRQFGTECRRLGIIRGFGGYYYVSENTLVYAANAGPRLRDQLSYLARERDKAKEADEATGTTILADR